MKVDTSQLRMHQAPVPPSPKKQPSARGLYLLSDRPTGVSFSFEHAHSRFGATASVASHVLFVLIVLLVMRYAPQSSGLNILPQVEAKDIVWLSEPGPGGGGGGGGNKAPEPPKKLEITGKEKVSVPAKKPEPIPIEPPKIEPRVEEQLVIPAKPMAAAEQPLPGALLAPKIAESTSQGSGSGGGGGTGTGTGSGPGSGSGLGPGTGGGTGGGVYRPGNGVSTPTLLREVKPQYTAEAMRAKIQGVALLEAVVMPDGTVGDVKIARSLDSVFGLDHEAIKAARQWKFVPGMRNGQPVAVLVTIELTFTLR